MNSFAIGRIGIAFLVVMAPVALRSDEVSPRRIAQLIEQLGSEDFDQREEAAKHLDALGEHALEPLAQRWGPTPIRRCAAGPGNLLPLSTGGSMAKSAPSSGTAMVYGPWPCHPTASAC